MENTTTKDSVMIKAKCARVWDALVKPEIVEKYFFGTKMETNWEPGSLITYRGEMNGQQYEDKGVVLEVSPEKKLSTTYWSSMSGIEDKPENYVTITYTLESAGIDQTELTVTQENVPQEMKTHADETWRLVLNNLKKLLEQQTQLHEA